MEEKNVPDVTIMVMPRSIYSQNLPGMSQIQHKMDDMRIPDLKHAGAWKLEDYRGSRDLYLL